MRRFAFRAALVVYLMIALSLMVVSPAAAYIDAGSGSLIIQAIVGFFVAIPIVIAVFWGRITNLFRRKN